MMVKSLRSKREWIGTQWCTKAALTILQFLFRSTWSQLQRTNWSKHHLTRNISQSSRVGARQASSQPTKPMKRLNRQLGLQIQNKIKLGVTFLEDQQRFTLKPVHLWKPCLSWTPLPMQEQAMRPHRLANLAFEVFPVWLTKHLTLSFWSSYWETSFKTTEKIRKHLVLIMTFLTLPKLFKMLIQSNMDKSYNLKSLCIKT